MGRAPAHLAQRDNLAVAPLAATQQRIPLEPPPSDSTLVSKISRLLGSTDSTELAWGGYLASRDRVHEATGALRNALARVIETILTEQRLPSIRHSFRKIAKDVVQAGGDVTAFLHALLEEETRERRSRRVQRRIHNARFRQVKLLADLDGEALPKGVTLERLHAPATGDYIGDAVNVIAIGGSGDRAPARLTSRSRSESRRATRGGACASTPPLSWSRSSRSRRRYTIYIDSCTALRRGIS